MNNNRFYICRICTYFFKTPHRLTNNYCHINKNLLLDILHSHENRITHDCNKKMLYEMKLKHKYNIFRFYNKRCYEGTNVAIDLEHETESANKLDDILSNWFQLMTRDEYDQLVLSKS